MRNKSDIKFRPRIKANTFGGFEVKFEDDPRRVISLEGGFLQLRPVDLRMHLERVCRKSTQKTVAKHLGISPQYLSDILRGRREISSEIAAKMGFDRIVTFVRWSKPAHPKNLKT